MRKFIRRPSPAAILAFVALFVALDMASLAQRGARLLNGGRTIANNTIPGRLIVRDTLTGREIRESRLGLVPLANFARNADRLDGLDSSDFARAGQALGANQKAADSDKLDGIDSNGFLPRTGQATDSDLLDGLNSTQFLRSDAKANDSDKLDGNDSSAFLGANAKAADSDKLDGKDQSEFNEGSTVRLDTETIPSHNTNTEQAEVFCAGGEIAMGGGARWTSGSEGASDAIVSSYPGVFGFVGFSGFVPIFGLVPANAGQTPTGWAVRVRQNSGANRNLEVYVTCANHT